MQDADLPVLTFSKGNGRAIRIDCGLFKGNGCAAWETAVAGMEDVMSGGKRKLQSVANDLGKTGAGFAYCVGRAKTNAERNQCLDEFNVGMTQQAMAFLMPTYFGWATGVLGVISEILNFLCGSACCRPASTFWEHVVRVVLNWNCFKPSKTLEEHNEYFCPPGQYVFRDPQFSGGYKYSCQTCGSSGIPGSRTLFAMISSGGFLPQCVLCPPNSQSRGDHCEVCPAGHKNCAWSGTNWQECTAYCSPCWGPWSAYWTRPQTTNTWAGDECKVPGGGGCNCGPCPACTSCPAGTVERTNHTYLANCQPCPAGQYPSQLSVDQACVAGFRDCPAGRAPVVGAPAIPNYPAVPAGKIPGVGDIDTYCCPPCQAITCPSGRAARSNVPVAPPMKGCAACPLGQAHTTSTVDAACCPTCKTRCRGLMTLYSLVPEGCSQACPALQAAHLGACIPGSCLTSYAASGLCVDGTLMTRVG
jgi:hypothetical protein